jgi:fructoselysine 3-epimerase
MLFSQSSAVYFNHSLKYAIRDLHDLGYQGIEIWGGRPHMYRHDLDEQMEEIVGLLKELNMTVCNFIPAQFRYPSYLCSLNEHVRKESVEYIKAAVDNTLKVGAPTVSLCPGMVLFDESVEKGWKQLVKSYKEIEEYVADKDIILLIEPAHRFESNLILTVEDCLGMIDELKSDKFGILLDTGHANVNSEKFNEILPKCKGIPLHIHLDDNKGDFDSHMIPGKGNVDFHSLFRSLKDIDYKGFISVELGGGYNMDPTSACMESLEFLKGIDI